MLQTPERLAVQNPVTVPFINRPDVTRLLIAVTPAALCIESRIRAEKLFFSCFNFLSDCQPFVTCPGKKRSSKRLPNPKPAVN